MVKTFFEVILDNTQESIHLKDKVLIIEVVHVEKP